MTEKKLAECQLDSTEKAQWLSRIENVLEFAGSPGDWGHKTELGELTIKLIEIRQKLRSS